MSPASDPTPVASPPHPPETTGDPIAPAAAVGLLLPVPMLVRLTLSTLVYFAVLAPVRGIPCELWSASVVALRRFRGGEAA